MRKFRHRTALYIIPWTSLLGGWFLGELSGSSSEIVGAWLLLFSALFFGLPHGAYDFWILFDSTHRKRESYRAFTSQLAIYLMLALAVVAVWYFLPSVVLIGFLALTAWHFGSGDAVWEANSKVDWLANSLGRGLLVMSSPLAFFPNESGLVLVKLNLYSSDILLLIAPYTLAGGVLLLLINSFVQLVRDSKLQTETQLFIWFETLALLLFFWFTTPLLAVTVYLIGVHSWRHLLRLEIYEQTEKTFQQKDLWQIIRRFHQRALPITLISLIGLGLIFWLWQMQISDLTNYTSAYLVLLSALTLPHAALITWTELNLRKSR